MRLDAPGIIDPHLHLFNLQLGHYHWLKPAHPPLWPDKTVIMRNYAEQDLRLNDNMALAGFVHIEAGFDNQQPWREIDWLEVQCRLPFKSVACADLCSAQFPQLIQKLSQRSSVVGIRHILDDDADTILNHPLVAQHFACLERLGWSFDAQLPLDDNACVGALIRLAMQFPSVSIIINHAGYAPELSQLTKRQRWAENLQKLSELSNVAIKLSGWELINRQWTLTYMFDSINLCLQLFGPARVMLASNFPLCTFSQTYAELWHIYQQQLQLSDHVWQQLAGHNAARWYQFI